ncbi:hypothetical protein H2200_009634 [Cladophialophora chaetospira]|uniref:RRM domain-containing protein n=1 Tax=Cladophialophora chaetospira TaxID=386627 RepID=A0AA38X318_9EURO|nr:hypothetical protein H2200_009634 [Cladophialophora chaetospira]
MPTDPLLESLVETAAFAFPNDLSNARRCGPENRPGRHPLLSALSLPHIQKVAGVAPSKYDDPAAISTFLKRMGSKPPVAKADSGPQPAKSSLNPATPDFSPSDRPGDSQPVPQNWENAAPQSATQQWNVTPSWQSPSQSPFPSAAPLSKSVPLDLIQDENGFVREAPAPVTPFQGSVLTPRNTNISKARGRDLTPTQYRLLAGQKPGFGQLTEGKLSELTRKTEGYMDNVIENFRKSHQPVALKDQVEVDDAASDADSIPFPEMDETPINAEVNETNNINTAETPVKQDELQEKMTVVPFNTPVADLGGHQAQEDASSAFPTLTETAIIKSFNNMAMSDSQAPTTPTNMTVIKDEPAPAPAVAHAADAAFKEQESPDGGVVVEDKVNTAGGAFKHTQSPTIVVTAGTETDDSVKEDDGEEDRENLTRFKAWGTPTARNKPRSRQRTVVLSGLPRGADYSLVSSVVHGGALVCMKLVPGNPEKPTVSAYITFVSADACDRYYDKYPNGFDVRHQGKRWPILVHKRDNVDVISGTLQGHLDCGATRVIKANNADDDWGIVALNKLAEGKTRARQVEAVHDTYHNGTRTITFRFANITDAVHFRGMLIRSDEWEGCHVEFAEDPCAKATGFHSG